MLYCLESPSFLTLEPSSTFWVECTEPASRVVATAAGWWNLWDSRKLLQPKMSQTTMTAVQFLHLMTKQADAVTEVLSWVGWLL